MGEPASLPPHLLPDREIHVVVSVSSGQRNAQPYYESTLKPFLDSHSLRYSTHITTSASTIIELTNSLFIFNARRGVKQTILLLSGDGGVIDIVDTLSTSLQRDIDDSRPPSIFIKPVICLIAQGTANALAWSSGVASDPLEALLNGRASPLPMFEVTFSPGARLVTNEGADREAICSVPPMTKNPKIYGAVVFSWGLHASLVAKSDTAAYREHGIERFKMAAEKLLEQNHVYKGLVKIRGVGGSWEEIFETDHCSDESDYVADSTGNNDAVSSSSVQATIVDVSNYAPQPQSQTRDKPDSVSHSYILATLVSNLEQHFQISPQTSPTQSFLHLVAIPHLPRDEIARIAHLPYQSGAHIRESSVTYKPIEAMQIDFREEGEEWRQVCVDGKIVAVEREGWVELKHMGSKRVVELVR